MKMPWKKVEGNLCFGKGFPRPALVDGDRRKQIWIDLVSLFSVAPRSASLFLRVFFLQKCSLCFGYEG